MAFQAAFSPGSDPPQRRSEPVGDDGQKGRIEGVVRVAAATQNAASTWLIGSRLALARSTSASVADRPHIVVILADDLGHADTKF